MANSHTLVEHRLDAEGADPLMLAGVDFAFVAKLADVGHVREQVVQACLGKR